MNLYRIGFDMNGQEEPTDAFMLALDVVDAIDSAQRIYRSGRVIYAEEVQPNVHPSVEVIKHLSEKVNLAQA